MIYVIKGTDTVAARRKFDALIESLLARKLDSSAFQLDADNFSSERLSELIISQDLFVHKYIVGCLRLLADKKIQPLVLEFLPEMAKSENIFVILEEEIEEKVEKELKPFVTKDLSFDKKLGEEKKFNIFALTDALGARDRRGLWVWYQKALRAGLEAEEVFWKLQWMVKNLCLVKKSKKPEAAGLKGFVLERAKKYSANYSEEELNQLSKSLVDLFYDSRRGNRELEIGLEELIFGI